MIKNYKLTLFSICITFFYSCELYNPAEPVPSYIHIDKITLTTDYTTQGSNSSKIADAWVYVDEKIIGAFELPADIPVLYEGAHSVKVRAGIKVNGIAATRAPYPFYTIYEQRVDLKAGEVVKMSPVVNYYAETSFKLLEDFENVGSTFDTTSNSDVALQIVSGVNVFEGAKSAMVTTNKTQINFESVTTNTHALPGGGAPVFLEFNYKCNHAFSVGVIANGTSSSAQFDVLSFNPSSTWNKIYVYLTPTISSTYNATSYNIVFKMKNTLGLDSASLALDNIKLVH